MTETTTPDAAPAPHTQVSAAGLRAYAEAAGLPVGTRGAIPAAVRAAFDRAAKRTQKQYIKQHAK